MYLSRSQSPLAAFATDANLTRGRSSGPDSDELRQLTVGQRRESEDENFPLGEALGQARTGSAQMILADQIPASESVRPKPREFVGPPPPATGKLTDSPLEDDSVQGRDEEKIGEPEPEEAARRQ